MGTGGEGFGAGGGNYLKYFKNILCTRCWARAGNTASKLAGYTN
jgi:hypothetical protein